MAAVRRLSAATVAPAGVATGFAALAALTGNPWFVLLAGGSAGLVIASFATRARLSDLSVRLSGPGRLSVGETATHRLQVHNGGTVTSTPVTVCVTADGLSDVRVHVERIPAGGTARAEVVRSAQQRGVFVGASLRIAASSPLGLLTARQDRDHPHRLVVHPAPAPPQPAGAVQHLSGDESSDPVPGVGLDLAGIREWRPGDDRRRVHWRSTARRDRLIVAERGNSPAPALSMLVVGPSEAPDWEALVASAAATARAAQLGGRPVDVSAWGPAGPSAAVSGSPVDLLDWWAALDAVLLPAPEDLVAARGGQPFAAALVVVASVYVTSTWWDLLHRGAAGAGLSVGRLTTP